MPKTQLLGGKDSESLAPGESSRGLRARATCPYAFPSGGWGCGMCVCTLLCTNPLALTPQPLTGYLLWGGHCEERREDVTRALTCKTVSSWRKRSRKLGDEGTKKIMVSVREGKGDPASSRGGSGI